MTKIVRNGVDSRLKGKKKKGSPVSTAINLRDRALQADELIETNPPCHCKDVPLEQEIAFLSGWCDGSCQKKLLRKGNMYVVMQE